MNQDDEQLRLLSIFHYIVGGLLGLFACIPFIHVALGIMVLTGSLDGATRPPAAVFGWLFVVFGGAFILFGWTTAALVVIAGRKLQRRTAHTFCFVVACIECLFTPFGTVLGIFTIIVLQRESVKRLFGIAPTAPPPAP